MEKRQWDERHIRGRYARRSLRPVNSNIIEELKCRCDDDDVIQSLNEIVPGDRVKIERGPLQSSFVLWTTFKMIGAHGSHRPQQKTKVKLN